MARDAGDGRGQPRVLLQRINRHVFRRPAEVMENMTRVTRHVAAHLQAEGVSDPQRRVLRLVPARDGAAHHVDAHGETWRLVPWIEGTRSVERAATEREARERRARSGASSATCRPAGAAPLRDDPRLPRHAGARRHVRAHRGRGPRLPRAEARPEIDAILDRRPLAAALAARVAGGELRERPAHNDAKIANVLFDERTGEALCVVDLDTVMPGLALHDFGDLVRSGVSDSDEDERDLARVCVRPTFYDALADGFVEGAGDALSPAERALLRTGAEVIVYEQALRFLGDYVDGDRYYKTARPGHNLDRARAQIALLARSRLTDGSRVLPGQPGLEIRQVRLRCPLSVIRCP